jgi:alkylated DNA repair dioxygenase AlkB
MRFHSDPGQGEFWCEDTAVVSVGDTRQFIMRRIDNHACRHVFYVSSGDCVRMFGDCQQQWQHCIKVEDSKVQAGGRVSFVFKQSMQHKGGQPP